MAFAQGVPTFDAGMFLQRERVLNQGAQDLALQQDRLTKDEELEELEQEQLEALEDKVDRHGQGCWADLLSKKMSEGGEWAESQSILRTVHFLERPMRSSTGHNFSFHVQ
ncbi:hypothetical protein SAMN05444421_110102 [Celeribacter marinus]|nr:hypothetical protein SAMN05444421_110102 [Celeribacter marinus]